MLQREIKQMLTNESTTSLCYSTFDQWKSL